MKPVLIIKDHPEFACFDEEYRSKELIIKAQADLLQSSINKLHKNYWNEVYRYLKDNKFSENPEKGHFTISGGVLYLMEKEDVEDSFSDMLFKKIFGIKEKE